MPLPSPLPLRLRVRVRGAERDRTHTPFSYLPLSPFRPAFAPLLCLPVFLSSRPRAHAQSLYQRVSTLRKPSHTATAQRTGRLSFLLCDDRPTFLLCVVVGYSGCGWMQTIAFFVEAHTWWEIRGNTARCEICKRRTVSIAMPLALLHPLRALTSGTLRETSGSPALGAGSNCKLFTKDRTSSARARAMLQRVA